MELKERYYRKLDEVLSALLEVADPNDADRRVKEISGEDWASIKEYIKTHKVASFASGMIWHVNQDRLKQSLTEVGIELDKFRQQKSEPRKEMGRQIIVQVASGLIISAISFIAGILYERYWLSEMNTDQKTEHSYNYEKKDSISNQPNLEVR